MRITSITSEPIEEYLYLNVTPRPESRIIQSTLPVLKATVDHLPDELDAIIATSDLQGRERIRDCESLPIKLIGEVIPAKLARWLTQEGYSCDRIGIVLAGDFYAAPDLRKRGATGDITSVWQAFEIEFRWVVGVGGNHDMFGDEQNLRPPDSPRTHFLGSERVNLDGIEIAGLSGIVGNPKKNFRIKKRDYLERLTNLLGTPADLLLTHDGPDIEHLGLRGTPVIRELLSRLRPPLVIRGHKFWEQPLAEIAGGTQILNVDSRIVLLTPEDGQGS